MLKRFEVKNYKNFKEKIVVDFSKVGGYQFNQECITKDVIGKALIYGRNATGKTNLGRAMLDIAYLGQGISYARGQSSMILNADSDEKYSEFRYDFLFDQKQVTYIYKRLSETKLLDEKMLVDGETAFYYNFETKENQFDNLKLLDADTAIIERFLEAGAITETEDDEVVQTLPFLRWLINNTALQENSVLLKLNDYIKRMRLSTAGAFLLFQSKKLNEDFYKTLSEDENLKDFEDFLNAMGVECKLELKLLSDGQRELYFVHNNLVSFSETASSGTIILTNLYRRLITGKEASFFYIDEFDAFYHYEMSEKVIRFFKMQYPDCQMIFTTHNTNLMTNKLMRPDCLFILSRVGKLTALCDATTRELREGHNLEKLYISGEFEKYE